MTNSPKIQRGKSACYCTNLRRAANSVTAVYDRFMAPISLSVTQYTLLVNISRLETCSISDLAVYMGLERTTLVRTLKPLFDLDYIVDLSDAGQRNRRIQLTPDGVQIMAQGKQLWANAQAALEQKMGSETLAQLLDILTVLAG
jgi:DNA-binding MarR family transcriptional regulator